MSEKALTPFERRSAAEFISSEVDRTISAQLKAADRIIVSQERIESGIDKVAVGLDKVSVGIEGLASAFEWGFSEIVWHLEQQSDVLKEILKVLQAPLDTQAKELKGRAEDAYRNGWIDDALQDFLQSENKNRYDFTIHQSLGNIYLFHKKNEDKALEYYEKAAKYATPKSGYHASLALLHLGLVRYQQGDYEKAYEATRKAIELSPNLYEAHYQCAQYCANLRKYDEAIERLSTAIKGDRNYCLKAESEKDFDVMRNQLRSFFEHMRDEAQSQAKEDLERTQGVIQYAECYDLPHSDKADAFAEALKEHKIAAEYLKRASLFDCWDATYKAWDAQELTLDSLEGYVSGQISRASEDNTIATTNLEKRREWWIFYIPLVILLGLHVLAYIGVAIKAFHEHIAEGILWLVFGVILLAICFIINGFVLIGLTSLIGWPIFHFLCKKGKARYESRLAELYDKFSEVKSKRSALNWEYKQEERKIE